MFVVEIVLLFNNNKHQGGVDAVLLKTVWFWSSTERTKKKVCLYATVRLDAHCVVRDANELHSHVNTGSSLSQSLMLALNLNHLEFNPRRGECRLLSQTGLWEKLNARREPRRRKFRRQLALVHVTLTRLRVMWSSSTGSKYLRFERPICFNHLKLLWNSFATSYVDDIGQSLFFSWSWRCKFVTELSTALEYILHPG